MRKEENPMRKIRTALVVLLGAGTIAGCTGGGVFGTNNPTVGNPVFNPSNAVLQLSVGTANDDFASWRYLITSGASISGPTIYLNAVATFRGFTGLSAFPTPGSAVLTLPTSSTFTIGSVFAYGQSAGLNGVGGLPPAYPSAGAPAAGFPTGFMTTSGRARMLSHPTGNYTLSTSVSQNGVITPYSASATLQSTTNHLGDYAAPVFTANVSHDGGGTFTVAPPAGVSETLIVVYTRPLSCGFAEVATVETTGTTATLPPGTLAAVCPDGFTTATYGSIAIGADYQLVEAGPPTNTQQTPNIAGSFFDSNSDLTFSNRTAAFTP